MVSGTESGGKVVMPGDLVTLIPEDGNLRLGSGTAQRGDTIVATKAGKLKQSKAPKRFWVETKHQRYVPALDDLVVGIVIDVHAENFTVDVGGPVLAQLPILDFNGATRRNRPILRHGDVVYARVTLANRDIDPIISCIDNNAKMKGLGPLKGGYTLRCTTGCARDLLSNNSDFSVLHLLGEHFQYECCMGVNGVCWIKGENNRETILIKNAIQNYQNLSLMSRPGDASNLGRKVAQMVQQLVQSNADNEE